MAKPRILLRKPPQAIAVFAGDSEAAARMARHVRAGAPELPVCLFSTVPPADDVACLFDSVTVRRRSIALLCHALRRLFDTRIALGLAAWTGRRGSWTLKFAPFLLPPFRVLLLNRHGDFFPGTPRGVARHLGASLRDLSRLALDYTVAGLLTLLAWCAPILRAAFRRIHGSATLTLDAPPAGSGVECFVQISPRWDGDALDAFAQSSSARWILWRQSDAAGPIAPVIDGPATFALSRQQFFRAWQPFLAPTAPFRQLQPGEASCVLAPVSDAILVDRAKLLALGVPRCSDAGSAWRILFWKAAAAGWRSYSIGGDQPLRDEPAQPRSETGFMLAVAREEGLRAFGPRDTLLSRGNIAFHPSPRGRRATSRLKVLIVSPFLPYPLSHGGAVRMYNLCRALADRVDFVLIAVREKDEPVHYDRLSEVFREVYTVDLDTLPRPSGSPRMVDHYRSESLRALVAEVARDWRPDLLQVEFTQMAAYRECAPGVPALLVEHDLTFSLYRQLAKHDPSEAAQEEHRRWLAFERRWLRDYDGVWTVSDADRHTAVAEGSRAAGLTYTIANGVDTERYTPVHERTNSPEILFVGSFRHLPNVIGFDKMAHEVMPLVWRDFPDARLRVVAGLRHEPFWSDYAAQNGRGPLDPRIEIHGFVEDLRPLYARASVVAAPLAVSAGTNIKVLEAMACGKAIVSTPAGCAGLDLHHRHEALICSGWPHFASTVGELLGDAPLRIALGLRARACAEQRFSWKRIADLAYASYLDVTGHVPAPHDIRNADGQAAVPYLGSRRHAGLAAVRPIPAEAQHRPDLRR